MAPSKRVLIISYYWPPSGGIGVHRCLKFAKYLRSFGWEPVVYTAKNALYPFIDEGNYKDVPEGITVLRKKILEPFALYKRLTGRKKDEPMNNPLHVRNRKTSFIEKFSIWVRGNFFIPDARALWIRPSVRYLKKYLQKHPVDAILSDGPPHTNTYIATKLAQKTGIPFLADFQDPWTQVDYYKLLKLTRWADRRHRKKEQEVFHTASKITIASPTWGRQLEEIGARNVFTIYWGYDEDDFASRPKQGDRYFSFTHAGMLGFDRKPETFLQVLSELKGELKGFGRDLRIRLAGMVDYSVHEEIKKHGLEKNTEYMGNLSREQALNLTMNTTFLLLPLNKAENVKGRIPGKLFENLRTYRPILSLGPAGSDVEKLINQYNCGANFDYEDHRGLKDYIQQKYQAFKSKGIQNCSADISPLSVQEQTRKLSGFLDEITGKVDK